MFSTVGPYTERVAGGSVADEFQRSICADTVCHLPDVSRQHRDVLR